MLMQKNSFQRLVVSIALAFMAYSCFGRESEIQESLIPDTSWRAPVLDFEFPGLSVGIAQYEEGPTGCTVFRFESGGWCAVDIRGGSPGVVGARNGWVDAICFAGGSSYGEEATIGVRSALLDLPEFGGKWNNIPGVKGAIIYDFSRRENAIYPDKKLARAALESARKGSFPMGAQGAGRYALVGKYARDVKGEWGGQGAAFRQIGKVKVAVFTVVNSLGPLYNRQGEIVRGNYNPDLNIRQTPLETAEIEIGAAEKTPGTSEDIKEEGAAGTNTTLTLVVTNQQLAPYVREQLAKQIHSSMARAIQPFHGLNDGDVLFFVSTNEIDDGTVSPINLGVIVSELAWDAVLNCYDTDGPPTAVVKKLRNQSTTED